MKASMCNAATVARNHSVHSMISFAIDEVRYFVHFFFYYFSYYYGKGKQRNIAAV